MPSSSSKDQRLHSREDELPSTVVGNNPISVLSDVSESMMPEEPGSERLARSFVPISPFEQPNNNTATRIEEHENSQHPPQEDEEAPQPARTEAQQQDEESLNVEEAAVEEAAARTEANEGPRFKDQSHSFLDSSSGNTTPSSQTTSNATLLSGKPVTYKPNIVQDQEVTPGLVEAQAILVPIEEMENEQEEPKTVSPLSARVRLRWLLLAMIIGAAIAVLITCTTGNCSSSSEAMWTSVPTVSPSASPPVDPDRASTIASVISGASFTDLSYPIVTDTAEALSLEWLIEADPLQLSVTAGLSRLTQRYAMGVLWFSLFGVPPPGADECGWDGVRACVNGVIGQLQMEQVSEATAMGGTLPPDLSLLSGLTNVSMPAMNLQGTLPETYSRWANLEELYLEQNQLTGTLPTSYKDMRFLRMFSIHENSLNGTIPSAYSTWTSLERLRVFDNQLTGSIPDAWPFLQELWGYDNGFTGTLPSFSWIRILVLYNNQLSGSIPESLAFNDVVLFELHKNQITGTLPSAFSRWTNGTNSVLETFYVHENDITGSMPLCETKEAITAVIVTDCVVECSCCQGCVS